MSADWFCKIGERKVGPLNGQQLKTIVAKGQLRPEHLVRRGSEGPWVAAGRIKGLFPEGAAGNAKPQGSDPAKATAKPLPKAAARPRTAKAAEAPAPPAADIPQGLTLGGQDKHQQLNFDKFQIDSTPVDVSRRKVKSGMQGLKKHEQQKVKTLLFSLIGGGMTIGLVVFIWGIATGKFSTPAPKVVDPIGAAEAATAADSTQTAKDSAEKKAVAEKEKQKTKEPEAGNWPRIEVVIPVGNVDVMILRPTRGAPPAGAKTTKTDVLVIPVRLQLKAGETKPIELRSWADGSLVDNVSLKDDQKARYDLLEQVNKAGKTIVKEPFIVVELVFEAPSTDKKIKFLHLALPGAAFHAGGATVYCEIDPSDIKTEPPKSAKSDIGDSAEKISQSGK